METKKRTLSKIILWRLITLAVTITVLQVYTHDIYISSTLGIIDHSICFILHYFYERMWGNIKWGIQKEQTNNNEVNHNEVNHNEVNHNEVNHNEVNHNEVNHSVINLKQTSL